ncbi:MAG: hypothetical protein V1790_05310 [Planctomycetota bacterium]
MVIIRAHFDGDRIEMPREVRGLPPGEVILIFENGSRPSSDGKGWLGASEPALAKAWDNDDDAAYDSL